jgi:hypothetical protein
MCQRRGDTQISKILPLTNADEGAASTTTKPCGATPYLVKSDTQTSKILPLTNADEGAASTASREIAIRREL